MRPLGSTAMASFTHDGALIAYDDISPAGAAERTIVLIHGFASNRNEGWRRTGWYGAFERRRMRVIALDQRGHGESAKLYEPEAYERSKLAGARLLCSAVGLISSIRPTTPNSRRASWSRERW